MTDIEILKKLTGVQDEALLNVVLAYSRDAVITYTNRTHMIPSLEKSVRDLAVMMLEG
mgnify:FL=1